MVKNGEHKCTKMFRSQSAEDKAVPEDEASVSKSNQATSSLEGEPGSKQSFSPKSSAVIENIVMPSKELAKDADGFSSPLFTGVMTFFMGIATMMKVSRTMSKKVTDANMPPSVETKFRNQEPTAANLPPPASISPAEMMTEEMLHTAVNRAHALEQELVATKKALEDAVAQQKELLAYIEKEKKKRKKRICTSGDGRQSHC
ncbi:hypothetical protein F3Y22_tig00117012pilonHSYRG00192 [Hibiscus syriacus]|uniref:Uncharacterized protein n=1 Tax=Hibiscus syriacus TaxID=106335 RepID=A0A6A2WCP4_HIBSY|nr:hypothetical protein F3Y22_tig00117012pilonHSYRG00192 [Hibiscus syriacus]